MNERLLQFIWQFQYFNKQELLTTAGEFLFIEKPGSWNHHQGPDFSEAVIRIGQTIWVGNIELHVLSSNWYKHQHPSDLQYRTVVLHVVWEQDRGVQDVYGNDLPTLVLGNRVPKMLLDRYRQMTSTAWDIPCRSFLPALQPLAWCAWNERLAAERLGRKADRILHQLKEVQYHWDAIFWRLLAANFGMKVNAALFEQVALTLPITMLARHRNHKLQIEALLMGQANLLSKQHREAYARSLGREYGFLQRKYQLPPVFRRPSFLRMRPAGFPTIRMAQLAVLLSSTPNLFSRIRLMTCLNQVIGLFQVTAGSYWNNHYRFDECTVHQPKHLGRHMAVNLLINTVIPMLYTYSLYHQDEHGKEKAMHWLYELEGERNHLTRSWQRSGIRIHSAVDSQALIELYTRYCSQKRCLDCAIGNKILQNGVSVTS